MSSVREATWSHSRPARVASSFATRAAARRDTKIAVKPLNKPKKKPIEIGNKYASIN